MIKNLTGIEFTPSEFRKLNKCLGCGIRRTYIQKDGLCNDCVAKDFQKCSSCGGILRYGEEKFYSYDIKEVRNEENKKFKAKQQPVKELTYISPIYSLKVEGSDMCASCIEIKANLKFTNICFVCWNVFKNSWLNYKLNGSVCEICAPLYKAEEIYGEKTSNN